MISASKLVDAPLRPIGAALVKEPDDSEEQAHDSAHQGDDQMVGFDGSAACVRAREGLS